MQFSYLFCLKSIVWFLNLSSNGVSEAPTCLLHSFFVSLETFASYTILGVRHLLSKGHWFRTLQLHPKYYLLQFKICLLCDDIKNSKCLIQQWLILTVLRLNILCIGCCFRKWHGKSLRNVSPTLLFQFTEEGGFNHIILRLSFSFSIYLVLVLRWVIG